MSTAFYSGSARAASSDLSKVCTRCGVEKPLTEFHNNRRKKDGKDPNCKLCNNARMRERYSTDPEVRASKIASTKQYHRDHPDWSKERLRAHHVANEEERAERARERGADPVVDQQRRDSSRRSESRRRAVKAQAEVVESITQKQLDDLLAEHEHQCVICERKFSSDVVLHWDHIQPLAREGAHTIENHQPLCGPCNIRKNATWPLTTERREEIKRAVLALGEDPSAVEDGLEVIA